MKANLSINVGKESWFGDVLAYTGGYLRVELRTGSGEEWPRWDAATPAKCVIHEADSRLASDGTILKQDREIVWVQVPPTWSGQDRRTEPRLLGGFTVRYEADGESGCAHCVDISAGGIRLRPQRALPRNARVQLEFNLPSDKKPVRTHGIVLRAPNDPDSEPPEIGVKFADTRLVDSVRIATYCQL